MRYKVLLFIGSLAATFVVGAGGGKLVEFSHTQELVYGKYASQDKAHGITFISRSDDYLLIKTFSGKTLVETSPFVEVDERTLRSFHILGQEYLQYEDPAHSDQPVNHKKPLSDTIQDLLGIREIGLLEKAAEAIGKKGVNGKNTPAMLPFALFVLRVTQLVERSHYSNTTSTSQRHKRESYMHCAQTCPPCPHDNCIGLCGKGCSCWKSVCGDCCWHSGCYDHDLCCKRSWLQTKCLLPVNFRCDQRYQC